MIFDLIFNILFYINNAIVGLMPTLPSIPTAIDDAVQMVFPVVAEGSRIIPFVFGDGYSTFFIPWILIATTIMFFEQIYHTFMWVMRKLPIGVN